MEKKFSDEELDKLLREQYLKEADLIEEALFSHELDESEIETQEETRQAHERLIKRLKEEGVYREEEPKVIPMPRKASKGRKKSGKEISGEAQQTEEYRRFTRQYKVMKVAGFVVVCILCVFAGSMTSEANRKYFIDSVKMWSGNDTRSLVDNDEMNERPDMEEFEAKDSIENELDVEVPEFMYRPYGFEYYNLEVNAAAETANLWYRYEGITISLYIDKKGVNAGSSNFSSEGKQREIIFVEEDDILVTMIKIKGEGDTESSYTAFWEINEVFYQFSGRIEKEEFIKIIKNMKY